MLKREWKDLIHNKIMLVVVAAIIMIPIIYAGLFLKSMWDPYGSLKYLPVAVVNEDNPVEYEGKTLQVGSDMVSALRDNDELAFNFVDNQVAQDGLRNGTYYMVITIPEDFSANATTLMDSNPKKMELKYETNPGTNYIASKMSETAIVRIKDEVASEVTQVYTQSVFDQIGTVGNGMQEAADGADQINDGTEEAAAGNQTISTNLQVLANSTLTFRNGAETLERGLSDYTDGVSQVNAGARELNDGVQTLTDKVPELTAGTNQLNEGVQAYTDGVSELNSNSGDLKDGASQISVGASQLADGVNEYVDGVNQLSDGAGQLTQLVPGVQDAATGMSTAATGMNDAATGISQASDGVNEAVSGISLANIAIDSCKVIVQGVQDDLNNNLLPAVNSAYTAVYDTKTNALNLMDSYNEETNYKLDVANQQIIDAQNTMGMIQGLLEATAASGGDITIDAGTLQSWATTLGDTSAAMYPVDTMDNAAFQTAVNAIYDGYDTETSGLTTALNDCANGLPIVAGVLAENEKGLTDLSTQLSSGADQLSVGANQLSTGATTMSAGADSMSAGAKQMSNAGTGIGQLLDGFGQLTENNAALTNGINTLASGSNVLSNGINTYTAGVSTLNSNSGALCSGTAALADGAGTLASGATQLANGTSTLYSGTNELVSNNRQLNSGAAQLANGSGQIHDGSQQLYNGSLQLGDGLEQLANGSKTLANSLDDGAKDVAAVKATDDTVDMFASPLEDEETQITKVPNNGHAMAPYMMSVGLWVGCLAFCLMYPLTKYKGKLTSGTSWWLSKASVLYPVAILQAICLILLLHFLNGFSPVEMGKTIAFACLTAMCFTSIMYFCNITLGKVGSFLMLVFMVVQLAGSAGTYPVEISPSFVSKIHNYLPFTYTVEAFRSTISGGESIRTSVIVLISLTIVFTALTIIEFQIRAHKIKHNKRLLIDFLEENGLA